MNWALLLEHPDSEFLCANIRSLPAPSPRKYRDRHLRYLPMNSHASLNNKDSHFQYLSNILCNFIQVDPPLAIELHPYRPMTLPAWLIMKLESVLTNQILPRIISLLSFIVSQDFPGNNTYHYSCASLSLDCFGKNEAAMWAKRATRIHGTSSSQPPKIH